MKTPRLVNKNWSPDCRAYHVHDSLSDQCEGPSSIAAQLGRAPGVVSALVERYRVSIEKSPVWDWSEVEPAIVEFLSAFDLRRIDAGDGAATTSDAALAEAMLKAGVFDDIGGDHD